MLAPDKIKLRQQKRLLELHFGDTQRVIDAELLRVYSPSAEVRGHGPGQEVLQPGKRHVTITSLEPSGNYGLRIRFDDGHDSGIYSWDYLTHLANDEQQLRRQYIADLEQAGLSRDPDEQAVKWIEP